MSGSISPGGGLVFNPTIAPYPALSQQPVPPLLRYRVPLRYQSAIRVAQHDTVLAGQTLVAAIDDGPASIHAASSGTILQIKAYTDDSLLIEISTDGLDRHEHAHPIGDTFRQANLESLAQLFHENGMVGLGGASYPVAAKLRALPAGAATLLLINAVECDPAMSCDKALITATPAEVVAGIDIAMHATQSSNCIVAIKKQDRMLETILTNAISQRGLTDVTVRRVPDHYPVGYERQLFATAANQTIKSDSRPTEQGLISFNIATCAAIADLVYRGQALTTRVTSVHTPDHGASNIRLRLGTPCQDIAPDPTIQSARPTAGSGVISPLADENDHTSVTPATNCLIVQSHQPELSCIRCGLCSQACPEGLQPQHLLHYARTMESTRLARHRLDDCIECGCCDYVCPSKITLTRLFQQSKRELKSLQLQREAANRAKHRFDLREARLTRQREENLKKLKQKQQQLENQKPTATATDPRKALLQAALQRARKKQQPGNER